MKTQFCEKYKPQGDPGQKENLEALVAFAETIYLSVKLSWYLKDFFEIRYNLFKTP